MIRTKGEPGTGDVIQAVRHMRTMNKQIRELVSLRDDEVYEAAKQLAVPVELARYVHDNGRLPVVNFAAGGVATPADAALMMELGAEGVFVGSGIFKSGDPAKRPAAIVQATANWQNAELLARLSENLGEAMVGINELLGKVDSLLIIPNDRLKFATDQKVTLANAFEIADDVLRQAVVSISDLIKNTGFINLDFADVSTIMKGAGYAHMAIGHGSGKDKAKEAANAVIASPLLETSIAGAKRLLINIAMSEDILSSDVDIATKMITDKAADDVEFIFGTAFKENMQDEMVITVIAAGFDMVDPDAPAEEETAEEPIPVDNPLVNDVKVSGNATQNANASAQTAQPQQSQPVDDDLMAIFNILDRK